MFVGNFPSGSWRRGLVALPERLRPSPLNFIVRGLSRPVALDTDALLVSFLGAVILLAIVNLLRRGRTR